MPKLRSIVDALVDLGEKVTGKPIEVQDKDLMVYGEDVTEVIDEITKNYEASGGGGGESGYKIAINNTTISNTKTEITNVEDLAIVKNAFDKITEDITDVPNYIAVKMERCWLRRIYNINGNKCWFNRLYNYTRQYSDNRNI